VTAFELHADEHLAPWGGTPSDDCRWCLRARRAAVLADVKRGLARGRSGDFGDEEITQPDADAVLPLADVAAQLVRR
jgi:hypothetical protein